tara:strand:+ start:45 stop:440 length:396 start_codon:yes stop_codon:yes gene_type:complete
MIDKNARVLTQKLEPTDIVEQDLKGAPNAYFIDLNVIGLLESSSDDNILDILCDKIRKDGKIRIQGVDGLEVCRLVYSGGISLEEANRSCFSVSKRLYSVPILKEYFLKKQWKINFVGMSNNKYLIEATRS